MSFDSSSDAFFQFLSAHFGAVCAGVVLFNAGIWWLRARRVWDEDPSRRDGEQKVLVGFILWLAVPFLIMEAGTTWSDLSVTREFLRPQDGNPYVLAAFGWVWGCAIAFALWVWFFGGAEFMARNLRVVSRRRHPFGKPVPLQPDDWHVKFGAFLLLVVYGVATAGMTLLDASAPAP